MPATVEAEAEAVTAGDRPLALLLDNAERGLAAMALRPEPRGVKAGLVISDVLAAAAPPLRADRRGEGLVGGADGTEEAALFLAAEGETPPDAAAAARGETAFRYRSRAVAMLPRGVLPGM